MSTSEKSIFKLVTLQSLIGKRYGKYSLAKFAKFLCVKFVLRGNRPNEIYGKVEGLMQMLFLGVLIDFVLSCFFIH